jgi:hypothetical protein
MMKMRGLPVSAAGVAAAYCDFLDLLIADAQDQSSRPEIERNDISASFTSIIMKSDEDKVALAKFALAAVAPEATR